MCHVGSRDLMASLRMVTENCVKSREVINSSCVTHGHSQIQNIPCQITAIWQKLWQKYYLTSEFFSLTIPPQYPPKRNRFAFSCCYQQGLPRSLSGECLLVLVVPLGCGIHLTQSNCCGLPDILSGITDRLKKCTSGLLYCWSVSSVGLHFHIDNLGHLLLILPWHLGCLLLFQGSLFHQSCICPWKKAGWGSLCVEGGGEAWGMKWDTFMEYCMLNNRLREGVMSLSRKHKHYVLIRRLIINKVQGRCSESRLFHWYLLGQRAPLIGQLKSTLLQSLIGITTFTDFLGTVLPFSLPLH